MFLNRKRIGLTLRQYTKQQCLGEAVKWLMEDQNRVMINHGKCLVEVSPAFEFSKSVFRLELEWRVRSIRGIDSR